MALRHAGGRNPFSEDSDRDESQILGEITARAGKLGGVDHPGRRRRGGRADASASPCFRGIQNAERGNFSRRRKRGNLSPAGGRKARGKGTVKTQTLAAPAAVVTEIMQILFAKFHGLGNEFIVTSGRGLPRSLAPLAREMLDRHTGVGADGFIVLLPPRSSRHDARARFFNRSEERRVG